MKKLFVEPYLEIVDICSLAYTIDASPEDGMNVGDIEDNNSESSEPF